MMINIEIVLYVVFGMVAGGPLWLLICLATIRQGKRWYAQRKRVAEISDDVRPVWRAVKVIRPPRWRVVEPPIIVDCEVVEK